MATFIKTKFNISDDQTNMVKYRLAANITEYHTISKLILQRIIITNFVVQWVIWGKVLYRIWNPHRISELKREKNIEIGTETTELCINKKFDFCGPVSHLI